LGTWVQLEDAAKLIPEDVSGVYNIESSEELDAFLKLYPEKVVRYPRGSKHCCCTMHTLI
jgi:hypothetical protein